MNEPQTTCVELNLHFYSALNNRITREGQQTGSGPRPPLEHTSSFTPSCRVKTILKHQNENLYKKAFGQQQTEFVYSILKEYFAKSKSLDLPCLMFKFSTTPKAITMQLCADILKKT